MSAEFSASNASPPLGTRRLSQRHHCVALPGPLPSGRAPQPRFAGHEPRPGRQVRAERRR